MRNEDKWHPDEDDEPNYAVTWAILGAMTVLACSVAAVWLWAVPRLFGA
jgi:hypothetical protein